jgi:hypothetical protein
MAYNGAFGFHTTILANTGLTFKGTWDANANNPFLQSGVGIGGEYYIVSVPGNTNLDGVNVWQVGDWAIFESTTNQWQKISNSVISAYSFIQDEGIVLPQQNILDFQGNIVTASNGTGKTIVTINETNYGIYAQTANSTIITATTTESTLIGTGVGTLSVPANGFFVGASFRGDFGGVLNTANNQTIRIRVKTAAGVIFLDSGVQNISGSVSNGIWTLTINFTIRQIGGVNVASIVSSGRFTYAKTVNGTVEGFGLNTINSTTFDTTILNTLEVTAQFGSNNAGNSMYSDIFVLNKIY